MPRSHSLTRVDFAKCRHFKRLNGAFFSISYGTIEGRITPGVACVVSSKVAKSAVARNRIKRTVRESMRPILTSIPCIYIFHARKDVETLTRADIRTEIQALTSKIKSLSQS